VVSVSISLRAGSALSHTRERRRAKRSGGKESGEEAISCLCSNVSLLAGYVSMDLENEKTETVNENENKENKNVDEFHEFRPILQQKQANTKVETESDIKAWKQFCFTRKRA